jgi:hypothetical protein
VLPAPAPYAFDWVERAVTEITKNPFALSLTRNRQKSAFARRSCVASNKTLLIARIADFYRAVYASLPMG